MNKQQHIIVIGASAGGVQALRKFVRQLPADFDALGAASLNYWNNQYTA